MNEDDFFNLINYVGGPTLAQRMAKRQKGHGLVKKKRGGGLDIQKVLAKTGRQFHWRGYQYLGPGTHLQKRLKRGDPGINRLDRLAKQHDIDYSKAKNLRDKHAADRKMIRAIEGWKQKTKPKKWSRKSCRLN